MKKKTSALLGTMTLCAISAAAMYLSKKSNREKVKKQLNDSLDKITLPNIINNKSNILPCNEKYSWNSEDDIIIEESSEL